MLSPGQLVHLLIEKPAVGGLMIGRVDGQVVLVGGAIPGERVRARITRVARGVAFADATDIEERSPDRRDPGADPRCGGCLYSHIAYARQLQIKAQVIVDAFSRTGRIVLPLQVVVRPSTEEGYRMRARLHVRRGRLGFFRGGTHDICDVRSTRQLLPETCDVLDRMGAGLVSLGLDAVQEIELSENVDSSERAVHLEALSPVDARLLDRLAHEGLNGVTAGTGSTGTTTMAGSPYVTDRVSIEGRAIAWRRHVLTFFQGNRFLLTDLIAGVTGAIEPGSHVVDWYAGAGLFSLPMALVRGAGVTAVEGDRLAAADLEANAQQVPDAAIETIHQPVETFTGRGIAVDALVVDPPRTGMSQEALDNALRLHPHRIVYVSCDVATLARDARRLIDAGYDLKRVEGFDMFPNTPHVETITVFEN